MAATAEKTAVVSGNDVSRIATLRDVSIKNGEVSGEIVNNSSDTLRDVVLEIRYSGSGPTNIIPARMIQGELFTTPPPRKYRREEARASNINPRRRFRCGATALSSST